MNKLLVECLINFVFCSNSTTAGLLGLQFHDLESIILNHEYLIIILGTVVI